MPSSVWLKKSWELALQSRRYSLAMTLQQSIFIFLYDKSSFCVAEAALLFIRHIYFIKSFNPRIRITFQVKHRLRSDWSKNIGTQAPTIPSLQ